jgi:predicted LPLAT superfamily acyltransferase
MAAAAKPPVSAPGAWRRAPEAGTVLGLRIVVAVASFFGRSAATSFLWILAVYYTLVSWRARRASRTFLSRIGEAPSFRNVVRHIHTFARVALDRLFFLRGRLDTFTIDKTGTDHLRAIAKSGKGAILLGSHLGSFEAMRAASKRESLKLSIVVDSRSAERLGRVLRELGGDANLDVIPVDPTGMGTALRVRDAIERGGIVGIMADRTLPRDNRNVTVDFLGAEAQLPVGPFVIAHTLRCPVYLVFGLFFAPNRYELHCEPFADSVRIDRSDRAASIRCARSDRYSNEHRWSFFLRSSVEAPR